MQKDLGLGQDKEEEDKQEDWEGFVQDKQQQDRQEQEKKEGLGQDKQEHKQEDLKDTLVNLLNCIFRIHFSLFPFSPL